MSDPAPTTSGGFYALPIVLGYFLMTVGAFLHSWWLFLMTEGSFCIAYGLITIRAAAVDLALRKLNQKDLK